MYLCITNYHRINCNGGYHAKTKQKKKKTPPFYLSAHNDRFNSFLNNDRFSFFFLVEWRSTGGGNVRRIFFSFLFPLLEIDLDLLTPDIDLQVYMPLPTTPLFPRGGGVGGTGRRSERDRKRARPEMSAFNTPSPIYPPLPHTSPTSYHQYIFLWGGEREAEAANEPLKGFSVSFSFSFFPFFSGFFLSPCTIIEERMF